ncbi:hypothetical protein [Petroclostridium sp. X23]|uniref:hypothetical protein n=1 Tax=Petroclostridium sp. X23 TaxID=3045146 RepID=UPI0024AD5C51|nr:hypothetical protein [Petroclostridium sp. X23]WHH60890.1 hypothetical protein QKW49_09385 [Petroclostridium sp. X23]
MNNEYSYILFMGLNLIYDYVLLNDQEKALTCIEKMLFIQRYVSAGQDKPVSFNSEIRCIVYILDLFKLRYETAFKYFIDEDECINDIFIKKNSILRLVAQVLHCNFSSCLDTPEIALFIKFSMIDHRMKLNICANATTLLDECIDVK